MKKKLKQKQKEIFMHSVKKDILNVIDDNKGAFFGKIVMRLKYPSRVVLKHLMDLKSKGIVYKDNDGGRYKTGKN